MKHILICVGVIFGFFGGHARGQAIDHSPKAVEVVGKFRQIDLLTQLIPLALRKEQIEKLLPVIERARAKMIQLNKDEDAVFVKYDAKVSDAIKNSIEKGIAPPKALLDELAEATMKMSLNRDAAGTEFTDLVVKTFNEVCNAGQKKAAANSLAPELLNPNLKGAKMTEADKLKFFVQNILLDPLAYEVLVKLSKTAS